MPGVMIVRRPNALTMPGLDAEKAAWAKEVESRLLQLEAALEALHPGEVILLDNLNPGVYTVASD